MMQKADWIFVKFPIRKMNSQFLFFNAWSQRNSTVLFSGLVQVTSGYTGNRQRWALSVF